MCSLSIVDTPELRVVTMNRDEAITRVEGIALHLDNGPAQAKFPIDQKAGGTWFGANRYGIAAALLNRYQGPQRLAQSSRGAIIPELMHLADIASMQAHLRALDCRPFNPFDLVLVDAAQVLVFSWPGIELADTLASPHGHFSKHRAPCFFTSSALRADEALPARQQCFVQWLSTDSRNSANPEAILRTLHWADSADPGIGIRMQRAQSHTKSICQLTLPRSVGQTGQTKASLALRYWNQAALNQLGRGNADELAQIQHWPALSNAA